MTEQNNSQCPQCGEPVESNWRICPVCEIRLQSPICPGCGQSVKENWKRCPACESLLVCAQCKHRFQKGESACPTCSPAVDAPKDTGRLEPFEDSVTGMQMVPVAGGTFQMGDEFNQGSDNERPVHSVTLDDFYIATTPVTQKQWCKLMPDNPSQFKGPDRPVEQITWDAAMHIINLLNQTHQGSYLFDLPTEAQWEYAARSGGKKQLYAGGDNISTLAWYEDNSRGSTQPVATKAANGLGLFDMSGNVWEWCKDAYQADVYSSYPIHNPFVDLPTLDRVIRGGSWHLDAWSTRCARRFSCARDFCGPGLGFRVVMVKL